MARPARQRQGRFAFRTVFSYTPRLMNRYKYLFGPVPSRRFGRSLGVDLVPLKTCSLNCVFCQLGPSQRTVTERREYVPVNDVIAELRAWMDADGRADYVTLSGSGEPTLHSRFGDVLDVVRAAGRIPSLLLTNGTLLGDAGVRRDAARADNVKVSLSAWDQASFREINRPHPDLSFEDLLRGYRAFRDEFRGTLWMEVFVLSGVNDDEADARRIAALAATVRPDRIQINTAVRPPAEASARPVPAEHLRRLAALFTPAAEVVAGYTPHRDAGVLEAGALLAMLRRRPCTARQVADLLGRHINEVAKLLGQLDADGAVDIERRDGCVYYVAARNEREET